MLKKYTKYLPPFILSLVGMKSLADEKRFQKWQKKNPLGSVKEYISNKLESKKNAIHKKYSSRIGLEPYDGWKYDPITKTISEETYYYRPVYRENTTSEKTDDAKRYKSQEESYDVVLQLSIYQTFNKNSKNDKNIGGPYNIKEFSTNAEDLSIETYNNNNHLEIVEGNAMINISSDEEYSEAYQKILTKTQNSKNKTITIDFN